MILIIWNKKVGYKPSGLCACIESVPTLCLYKITISQTMALKLEVVDLRSRLQLRVARTARSNERLTNIAAEPNPKG